MASLLSSITDLQSARKFVCSASSSIGLRLTFGLGEAVGSVKVPIDCDCDDLIRFDCSGH
jgi:hypothetical protein